MDDIIFLNPLFWAIHLPTAMLWVYVFEKTQNKQDDCIFVMGIGYTAMLSYAILEPGMVYEFFTGFPGILETGFPGILEAILGISLVFTALPLIWGALQAIIDIPATIIFSIYILKNIVDWIA